MGTKGIYGSNSNLVPDYRLRGWALSEQVAKTFPTVVPIDSFSATMFLPMFVAKGTALTPLANTNDGNSHGGGIDVADGVGYCVGEAISS